MRCNRMTTGPCIEACLKRLIERSGLNVEQKSHAKAIDLTVNETYHISVKNSNSGEIRIFNFLGEGKKTDIDDDHVLLVLRKDTIYLLSKEALAEYCKGKVTLKMSMKMRPDALVLQESFFTKLNMWNRNNLASVYPYIFNSPDLAMPVECENREAWRLQDDLVVNEVQEKMTTLIINTMSQERYISKHHTEKYASLFQMLNVQNMNKIVRFVIA